MSFSRQLKKVMAERNISQSQLAELIEKGKPSVSQYLSGKNIPRFEVQQKIAEALDCTVEYLNAETSTSDPQGLKNVSVSETAKRIGKSEQYVRVGLQRQRLPFGTAVMISTRWSYHISPKLLEEYIGKDK